MCKAIEELLWFRDNTHKTFRWSKYILLSEIEYKVDCKPYLVMIDDDDDDDDDDDGSKRTKNPVWWSRAER